MAGSFGARTRELEDEVGHGKLTMKLTVHQPYAAAEHNRFYYRHDDGMAGYVEIPFMIKRMEMLQKLANGFPRMRQAAIDTVGDFEDMVEEYAPTLSSTLKNSCNLDVIDNGAIVYHKEQTAPFRYDKE